MMVELSNVIFIPFNIKKHIYTLSFTNPRIINGYESPCFYDFHLPFWPILFIDTN